MVSGTGNPHPRKKSHRKRSGLRLVLRSGGRFLGEFFPRTFIYTIILNKKGKQSLHLMLE